MMPSVIELEYFLEVSNTRNLSRAAERLGVTQPTLSVAMQRLEQSMGTPLFLRSRRGVQLTSAGEKLAHRAQELKQAWDCLRQETLKADREVRGQYSLGCHPSVGLYCLPVFVKDLLETHPSLELKIVHDLSRRITEEVISFQIDFGIVVNPVNHKDLVIREIGRDRVCLWTCREPSELQKLDSKPSVLICDPSLLQTQFLLKKLGSRVGRILPCSNLEVIAAMVAAGAGLGILPGRVATRIPSYRLESLLSKQFFFEDRICLIYRADYQKSPASRLFARQLRALLTPV